MKVDFKICFYGGVGSIKLRGDGFSSEKEIVTTMPEGQWSFTVDQHPGHTLIGIRGFAPDSSEGKVTIEVSSGDKVLSSAEKNTFTGLIEGYIIYDLKAIL